MSLTAYLNHVRYYTGSSSYSISVHKDTTSLKGIQCLATLRILLVYSPNQWIAILVRSDSGSCNSEYPWIPQSLKMKF